MYCSLTFFLNWLPDEVKKSFQQLLWVCLLLCWVWVGLCSLELICLKHPVLWCMELVKCLHPTDPGHNYPNSSAVMPGSISVTVLDLLIINCGYSKCERQFWRLMLLGDLLLLILVAGGQLAEWEWPWLRVHIQNGGRKFHCLTEPVWLRVPENVWSRGLEYINLYFSYLV